MEIPFRFDMQSLTPREHLVPQKQLVKIVAGCLMPNHFHFLLTPLQENGVSRFMHKVGVSYSMYFNKCHERTGGLFEKSFKAKMVNFDEYANHLTHYIHLNPVDLFQTRSGTREKIVEMVKSYAWSSLPDYLGGKSNLSLIIDAGFRDEVLGMDAEIYKKIFYDMTEDMFQTESGTNR